MRPESKTRAGLPTHAEALAIADRARRMRAQVLRQMFRAVWSRIARRPAVAGKGAPASATKGVMPHARA